MPDKSAKKNPVVSFLGSLLKYAAVVAGSLVIGAILTKFHPLGGEEGSKGMSILKYAIGAIVVYVAGSFILSKSSKAALEKAKIDATLAKGKKSKSLRHKGKEPATSGDSTPRAD